jgi:hypothetical protein
MENEIRIQIGKTLIASKDSSSYIYFDKIMLKENLSEIADFIAYLTAICQIEE